MTHTLACCNCRDKIWSQCYQQAWTGVFPGKDSVVWYFRGNRHDISQSAKKRCSLLCVTSHQSKLPRDSRNAWLWRPRTPCLEDWLIQIFLQMSTKVRVNMCLFASSSIFKFQGFSKYFLEAIPWPRSGRATENISNVIAMQKLLTSSCHKNATLFIAKNVLCVSQNIHRVYNNSHMNCTICSKCNLWSKVFGSAT